MVLFWKLGSELKSFVGITIPSISRKGSNGGSDKIVGHHPKEVSRITKFLLNRGATITAEITSDLHRRSPLVQGGLEVPCKIKVTTPTYFNMNALKKYEDLLKELYVEPKNEEILGTFVDIQSQDTDQNHEESLVRKRKQSKTTMDLKTK